MNVNFELYKIFYYVAKNQNITKTAVELMISQPAVSKSIHNLEEQVNCSLFVRTKSGVLLTDEGRILYEQIKQAMEIILGAEEKLAEMINLEQGYLRIGASNTLTKRYLLPFIKEFHQAYPNIQIKIYTDPTFELITKVRNGIIDFIILNLPYEVPLDFTCLDLKEVQDCFVVSKDNTLAKKKLKLEELNQYPLILMAKGSNTRYFLDDFCSKYGVSLNPSLELASYSLVTEFTKAGMGIGIVTKEYLDDELESGELVEVSVTPAIPKRRIGTIYLKHKSLSCSAKMFLDLLIRSGKDV